MTSIAVSCPTGSLIEQYFSKRKFGSPDPIPPAYRPESLSCHARCAVGGKLNVNHRGLDYVSMEMRLRYAVSAALLSALAFGQALSTSQKARDRVATTTSPATSLSEDQIRQIIRESADKDIENDKKQRDYTYVERQVMRRLDRKGHVKSTEVKTYDVMQIYGEQVQKLISKDD